MQTFSGAALDTLKFISLIVKEHKICFQKS